MTEFTLVDSSEDPDDDDYEKVNSVKGGNEWIISIDMNEQVSILGTPNIHYSFF